jgi:hypothetical protein
MKQISELIVHGSPHPLIHCGARKLRLESFALAFAAHIADRAIQKLRARWIAGTRLSAYTLGNIKTAVYS